MNNKIKYGIGFGVTYLILLLILFIAIGNDNFLFALLFAIALSPGKHIFNSWLSIAFNTIFWSAIGVGIGAVLDQFKK